MEDINNVFKAKYIAWGIFFIPCASFLLFIAGVVNIFVVKREMASMYKVMGMNYDSVINGFIIIGLIFFSIFFISFWFFGRYFVERAKNKILRRELDRLNQSGEKTVGRVR